MCHPFAQIKFNQDLFAIRIFLSCLLFIVSLLYPQKAISSEQKTPYCIARHKYEDDRILVIAISQKEEFSLSFSIPGGGFIKGEQYDLNFSLDSPVKDSSIFSKNVRATATDEQTLLLKMGKNASFKNALSKSRAIILEGNGTKISFALPEMEPLLEKLKNCKNEIQKKDTNNSIFPEKLGAFLIAAGFSDFEPVEMKNIPSSEKPSDFVWRTGKLFGGIRERPAPKDKSLEELVGIHLRGLKKRCNSSFSAVTGKREEIPGIKIITAEAECKTNQDSSKNRINESLFESLLFYVTEKGRFTVFTHECLLENKEEAIKARDSIKKAIISLVSSAQQNR